MHDSHFRAIWLAFAALAALIVAILAGGISWIGDRDTSGAILVAGAAFAGTFALIVLAIQFVSGRSGQP